MVHDNDWMPEFSGPFKEQIPEYIAFKRACGYKMGEPNVYKLREMDLFFRDMGITEVKMTCEMYEAFASVRDGEKPTNTEKRASAFKGFARYLRSAGYKDIYTAEDDKRIFRRDFIPYVFSREEISHLLKALDEMCRSDPGVDNDTFRLLIIIYYCCGLRRSEALNLDIGDVDLERGTLTVLHGKNDVTRLVPLSDSAKAEMEKYSSIYRPGARKDEAFFISDGGERFSENRLYTRYHRLLNEAGIQARPDGGRQRLHDLRHSFSVHTLETMQEKGFDLYTSLPLLSTYLGHKHITETEYYLRLMDEHFGGILEKNGIYTGGIMPQNDDGAASDIQHNAEMEDS